MINDFTIDFEEAVSEADLLAEKEAITKELEVPVKTAEEIAAETKTAEEVALAKEKGINPDAVSEEELAKAKAEQSAATGDETNEGDTSKETDVVAAVQGYANFLKEAGILGEGVDVTSIKSSDDLLKAQTAELDEWKRGYLESLPPVIKQLAENWEEGVPLNDLINIKSNQIKYSTITEEKLKENTGLQKDIYKSYLKETTKFSDKKINDLIEKAEDDFTLEELVKDEALPELQKYETEKEQELVKITKKQQEEAKAENETRIKHYQETINRTVEFIPGVTISKLEKDNIYKNMVTPIAKDGYGNPVTLTQAVYLKDPAKFDAFVTYMVMKTKGLEDFSFITNEVTTKATKKLADDFLNKAPKKATGGGVGSSAGQNFLDVIARNLPTKK